MSGGGGGGNTTISTTEQKLGTVRIQSSSYGLTLPLGYGRNRVPGNLLWYANFLATAHTSSTTTTSGGSGGKGGGSSSTTTTQTNTTYTYSADAMMGLVEGPIASIQSYWKNKDHGAGIAFSGAQTVTENLTVPSTLKVRLSFYAFYTSVASVVLVQSGSTSTDVTLTNPSGYTIAAGIITIASAANAGRVIRVTYNWTPAGSMLMAGADVGLTLFKGGYGQATWSYIASASPSQAVPYNNTAYVAAAAYALNTDATFANHNFELNFKLQYSTSIPDANPADILADVLTNPDSGAQFPGEKLGDLTLYSNYCRAFGLFISPVFIEQQEARGIIGDLLEMTNSAAVWSEGLLKIIPYGDTAATANGATYTPNVTPLYDLDDTDFLVSGTEDPVMCERKTNVDAYNQIRIEILNRANSYNPEIVERKDQANIEAWSLHPKDLMEMHGVCDTLVASHIAQLILQRQLYVRNNYRFQLGWRYALLEPMDLVTLTDSGLGLSKTAVRIISIDESETGTLSVVAEDFPAGVAHSTQYPDPVVGGYSPLFNADPGNVAVPKLFESPIDYTPNDNMIWAAVTGNGNTNWGGCEVWYSLDGVSYKKWGKMFGGSRYGTLSATIDNVEGSIASVALTGNGGQMLTGTTAEANADATLCWIDGEYFDYTTATLTGTNAYNITTKNRGRFASVIAPHAIGASFVRVDQAVAQIGPFGLKLTGQTFYFKFLSFNVYGKMLQTLAAVSPYTYIITRDVSSDNILTPREKPSVILDYDNAVAEQAGIDAQATALSITTEKIAYDAALAALVTYMATLVDPVGWRSLNGNTTLP